MKRRGFSPDAILNIKRAYKAIYRQGLSIAEAKNAIDALAAAAPEEAKPHLAHMKVFLDEATRGIIR